ncbi:holin [Glutamicibacter arilaitensis]|uniref:holin n=1 Tax=Glutamicibacter arilaitensis TaxID=256701 RepID=UPI00384A8277
MFTLSFWKGAAERLTKTFVQSFIATLVASIGAAVSAWDVPWEAVLPTALGVGLLSAILSLATSLGNADFTAGKSVTVKLDADEFAETVKERLKQSEITQRIVVHGPAKIPDEEPGKHEAQ